MIDILNNLRNSLIKEIDESYEGAIPVEIRVRKRTRPIEIKSTNSFSPQLELEISNVYSAFESFSILWDISQSLNLKTFTENEWFQNNISKEEYSLSFISEILGGNINIVSHHELLTDKDHLSYLRTPTTEYLPFDRHWSLTACLKKENGKVENNLYLFNAEDPGPPLDMKIGLLRYLELAYQAKLLYHWQYAYMFRDSFHNEKMRVMLPLIFPHVKLDLSGFGIKL
jgi:hypothetical protein